MVWSVLPRPCERARAEMSSALVSSETGWRESVAHHLVGEDAVDAVVVQAAHPVETLHLVLAHLAALDVRRRLGEDKGTLTLGETVGRLLGLEKLGVLVLLRPAATRLSRLAATALYETRK